MKYLLGVCAILFVAGDPYYKDQEAIKKMWPAGVEIPDGLRFYRPTRWAQYVVIQNGLDHRRWIPDTEGVQNVSSNPNSASPWRVPGGLEGYTGWRSYLGSTVDPDKVQSYIDYVDAGARRDLPMRRWKFPPKTTFVDLLVDEDGKPFELRMRRNHSGEWKSEKVWSAKVSSSYRGHLGSGRTCSDCHSKPSTSEGYGIRLRGDDGAFSFPWLELAELKGWDR